MTLLPYPDTDPPFAVDDRVTLLYGDKPLQSYPVAAVFGWKEKWFAVIDMRGLNGLVVWPCSQLRKA